MPKLILLTLITAVACHVCTPPQPPLSKNPGVPDRNYCQTQTGDPNKIDQNQMFIRQNIKKDQLSMRTEILVVSVQQVVNPKLEPLTFRVSLELPAETIEVGAFSLFPPNEPGIFRFRINQYISKIMDAQSICLIIKNNPEPGTIISDEVSVIFDEAKWE